MHNDPAVLSGPKCFCSLEVVDMMQVCAFQILLALGAIFNGISSRHLAFVLHVAAAESFLSFIAIFLLWEHIAARRTSHAVHVAQQSKFLLPVSILTIARMLIDSKAAFADQHCCCLWISSTSTVPGQAAYGVHFACFSQPARLIA